MIGIVIAVDASRALVSQRAARRYRSAAFQANALHFAGDLAGSIAVLVGLLFAAAGYPKADSAAAALRRGARARRGRAPDAAQRRRADGPSAGRRGGCRPRGDSRARAAGQPEAAADAPGRRTPLHGRRDRRARRSGGRPGPRGCRRGRGRGPARAARRATWSSTSSPRRRDEALGERASVAALTVPRVREVHNVRVVNLGDANEVSLHLKLPGDLTLEQAHDVASQVERAIADELPEVVSVLTHLEPLRDAEEGSTPPRTRRRTRCAGSCSRRPGKPLRASCASSKTPEGLVVYVALALDAAVVARGGARAGERDRGADPRRGAGRRRRGAHRAVRLCMFSPPGPPPRARLAGPDRGRPRDPARGADASVVLQRRRQAREHAEYPLDEVDFRAPVLHPPSVRHLRRRRLRLREPGRDPRAGGCDSRPGRSPVAAVRAAPTAAIVGGEGEIGGFTLMNVHHGARTSGARRRATSRSSCGPVVVTARQRTSLR